MTMVIAAVAFWGYLNIKTTGDDQKDNLRKFDSILEKVNIEWGRERVDGLWKMGKEGGWVELEVSGKYKLRNGIGNTTTRTMKSSFSQPNFQPREPRKRSRSPTSGSSARLNRNSPTYRSEARFQVMETQENDPRDNYLSQEEFEKRELDKIAEMRLKMQYEGVNPLTLEPKTPKSPKYRSIDRNQMDGDPTLVTSSPVHEYSDDEKNRYEKPTMTRNMTPSRSNQSIDYYKRKAIEDARKQHMSNQKQVIETKEIYRTPGYQSRDNSPTSKEESYKGNYKQHKRLTSGVGYDNSSATLQSTAVLDTTDYTAKSRKHQESPRFSPKPEFSTVTNKWINETDEQPDRYISPHSKNTTPFQNEKPLSNTRKSSRSRSRSSRCKSKPRFEIVEDN